MTEIPLVDRTMPEEFADYGHPVRSPKRLIDKGQILNPATIRGFSAVVGGLFILFRTESLLTVVAVVLLAIAAVDLYYQLRPPRRLDISQAARVLIGVGVGLFILVFPDQTSRAVSVVATAYLLVLGVADGVEAWRRRSDSSWTWPAAKAGVKLALGFVVLVSGEALLGLVVLGIAVSWIVAGAIVVVTNLRADTEEQIEVIDTVQSFLRWLELREHTADDRAILYQKIFLEGPDQRRRLSRFFALMAFSTAIATFGVIQDSTAVVIGAMLVAPLMTPLMGTAASLIMGWPRRATRSALVTAGGVVLAIGFSLILAELAPELINVKTNSQIVSRISPNLLDLMIAIAAGGAGAFALSRPDVGDALPGVAVAIALVPPLTVVGITLSVGEGSAALGALLLFATNAVAILFAGSAVFVITGFTPFARVLENREWVGRMFMTVAIGGLVIFAVLAASQAELTFNVTSLSNAQKTVESWVATQEDMEIFDVSLSGNEVMVLAGGPEPPTDVESLAGELASALGGPVKVTLDWIPRLEVAVTAVP